MYAYIHYEEMCQFTIMLLNYNECILILYCIYILYVLFLCDDILLVRIAGKVTHLLYIYYVDGQVCAIGSMISI